MKFLIDRSFFFGNETHGDIHTESPGYKLLVYPRRDERCPNLQTAVKGIAVAMKTCITKSNFNTPGQ